MMGAAWAALAGVFALMVAVAVLHGHAQAHESNKFESICEQHGGIYATTSDRRLCFTQAALLQFEDKNDVK